VEDESEVYIGFR